MYAGVFLQLHGNLRNNVIVLRNKSAFRVVPTYRRWQLVDGFSFDSPFDSWKKGSHLSSFEIGNARWIFLKRTTHTRTPLLYLVIGRQGIALFYSSVYNTCVSPVIKSTSTSDVSTGAYRLPTELRTIKFGNVANFPFSSLRFSFDRQLSLITLSLFILLHPLDPLSQRFFVVPTTTPSRSLLPSLQFFQFLLLVFSFSIISIALFSFVSIASVVTTRRVVNFVHVHDRDTIRNDATIFQKRFQTIRLVLVI